MSRPSFMSSSPAVRAFAGLAGLVGLIAGCGAPPVAPPQAPPKVTVQVLKAEDVPFEKVFVGRAVSAQQVAVQARISGPLLKRPFTEGGMVHEGELLFLIDPAEYQSDLDTALAKEAQSKAQLAKTENDLKRIEPLALAGAAPQQDLDNARTAKDAAKADARAAKAAVANAKLKLGYTTITAPFAGRVGKAAVDQGALVTPQSGTLVTIDQVDPIAVEFTISEQEILNFRAEVLSGRVASVGLNKLIVKATLLDGRSYGSEGSIDFADIRIRPETGTALVRAKFPNGSGDLHPGQFVRVTVAGLTRKNALQVPQGAVIQGPTGASLFVVTVNGDAESRAVTLGEWNGRQWRILDGVRAGETVVVGGVQKVRPGAKVDVTPAAEAKK